jgi:hypothetical protein
MCSRPLAAHLTTYGSMLSELHFPGRDPPPVQYARKPTSNIESKASHVLGWDGSPLHTTHHNILSRSAQHPEQTSHHCNRLPIFDNSVFKITLTAGSSSPLPPNHLTHTTAPTTRRRDEQSLVAGRDRVFSLKSARHCSPTATPQKKTLTHTQSIIDATSLLPFMDRSPDGSLGA